MRARTPFAPSFILGPLLCTFIFLRRIHATPLQYDNVTLPLGVSNHGDPDLLCTPTRWTDIALFFLGNYVAHAATISSPPGASFLDSALLAVTALFIPIPGNSLSQDKIFSRAKLASTNLQAAARAGALCKVIVADTSTNKSAAALREPKIFLSQPWIPGEIHGRVRLPAGYGLSILQTDANCTQLADEDVPITLSVDYSALKILVSIGQVIFAVSTLYRTRGDQIDRYGYAAFGLTVIQYALMSLLNLFGSLMCPQYPALYLVESRAMREARTIDGAVFDGVVGRVIEDENTLLEDENVPLENENTPPEDEDAPLEVDDAPPEDNETPPGEDTASVQNIKWPSLMKVSSALFAQMPTATTVAIIGLLSHFDPGSSTLTQRFWTMTWLLVGNYFGPGRYEPPNEYDITRPPRWTVMAGGLLATAPAAVPAIGGYVVVGQMLQEYGVCTRVS